MLPTIEIIKLFVKKMLKKVVLIDVKKGKRVLLHKKDASTIVLFNKCKRKRIKSYVVQYILIPDI
jgi:hypothetical protein